jgi:hypothetical protein
MLSQMIPDSIVIDERIVDIKQKDDVVRLGHGRSSLAPPCFIDARYQAKVPRQGSGGSDVHLGLCRIVGYPQAGDSTLQDRRQLTG